MDRTVAFNSVVPQKIVLLSFPYACTILKRMNYDGIIEAVKSYFSTKDDVRIALIYGSFAQKTCTKSSDIDIAVNMANSRSPDRMVQIQIDLSKLTGREIDIADLLKTEGIFLHQIISHCIKIKYDHNLLHYYQMKAIYFYEDFLPYIRRIQDAHIRRFVNGS